MINIADLGWGRDHAEKLLRLQSAIRQLGEGGRVTDRFEKATFCSSEPAPGGRLVSRLSGCGRRRRRQADTRRPDQSRRRSTAFGEETAEIWDRMEP